jgi:hypothetical protein
MADYPAKQIYSGTTTTVISHAAVLANAANTYNGLSGCTMTQLDNSTGLYTHARAVLGIPDTFAAAPTAGATIDLYYTLDDIDGTSDETPVPAATDIVNLGKWAGSWIVDNQDVANIKPIVISLLGVTKAQFYILNSCGQQISYASSPTTVKITPFSVGVTV